MRCRKSIYRLNWATLRQPSGLRLHNYLKYVKSNTGSNILANTYKNFGDTHQMQSNNFTLTAQSKRGDVSTAGAHTHTQIHSNVGHSFVFYIDRSLNSAVNLSLYIQNQTLFLLHVYGRAMLGKAARFYLEYVHDVILGFVTKRHQKGEHNLHRREKYF